MPSGQGAHVDPCLQPEVRTLGMLAWEVAHGPVQDDDLTYISIRAGPRRCNKIILDIFPKSYDEDIRFYDFF